MNQVTMDMYFQRDWSGIDGGQLLSQLAQYPDVVKALQATGNLPRSGPGVDALGVEDVSATMASAEYLEEELILWKRLRKVPAKSLVKEFSRLDSYGQGFVNGFIGTNDAGIVRDPSFTRGSAIIKYMAEKFETDVPTSLIEAIGPDGRGVNVANTNRMAAMGRLLRNIEREILFSDTRLDAVQWKGIFQWIDEAATLDNRIRLDLRGGFLNKYVLMYMSQISADNHANPTEFFIPNPGYLDLQLSFFPGMRTGEGVSNAAFGNDFDKLVKLTLGGNPDKMEITRMAMLTYGISGGMPLHPPTVAVSGGPAAPTTVTATVNAFTATASRPGLKSGNYVYEVVAISKAGNSLGTASGVASPTDGQKVTLQITHPSEDVLYYLICRNKTGESGTLSANRYYLDRVARPAGAVTVNWDDDGFAIPDTYHGLQVTLNPTRFYMAQLLSVMERKLPPALMTQQSGLLYFATPMIEEPTRQIHLVNVGRQPQLAVGVLGDQAN